MKEQHKDKSEHTNNTYIQFWDWFTEHSEQFLEAVKDPANIESEFFEVLMPQLQKVNEGLLFLTGMHNKTKAELVFTADGVVKNIIFVEELVAAAPKLDNWIFTALKPEHDIEDINIEISGLNFEEKNIHFYAKEHERYPDEIDLVVVYENFTEENKEAIFNGTFIFLDHLLGEINSIMLIDHLSISAVIPEGIDLIPISKLKDYLVWRQKEFVERYNDTRFNSEDDQYTTYEAQLEDGNRLLAIMNNTALAWDGKSAHPWIMKVTFQYDSGTEDGFPDGPAGELMDEVEQEIAAKLSSDNGYIHIGRETGGGIRDLYIACTEFRNSSKVMHDIIKKYAISIKMEYTIFKDKYWQTFERYSNIS